MPKGKSYSKSYYKKRPLWQWIVIYLVVGGIAYFVIYYFVFARNKVTHAPSGTNTSTSAPTFSLPGY